MTPPNDNNQTEMTEEKARERIAEYKKAFTMGGPDEYQTEQYFIAKGFLSGYSAGREEAIRECADLMMTGHIPGHELASTGECEHKTCRGMILSLLTPNEVKDGQEKK